MEVVARPSADSRSASLPFRSRAPPTAQDWEGIRPIFTQLYSIENKELKAVMHILANERGFHATSRMYNRRINDWKIHKNYKKSEKAAIVQAFKIDRASNKTVLQRDDSFASDIQLTGLTFKGRPIKVDRLVRYVKETHSSNNDPRPFFGLPADPTKLITDYGENREVETLYRCASQHLDFYLAYRIALRPSGSQNMPHGIANTLLANDDELAGGLDEKPFGFSDKLQTGIRMHCQGRFSAALHILNEAMDDVRSLFSRQHPNLLSRFFHILLCTGRAYPKLMQCVWNFITDMAKTMLGKSHPVVLASGIVRTLTTNDSKMSVWRTLNDILRNGLGTDDVGVLRAENWHLSTLLFHRKAEEALQDLDLRSAGNRISNLEYFRLQGLGLAMLGRYGEAEIKLKESLEITKHIRDDVLNKRRCHNRFLLRQSAVAMADLAIVLKSQGKYLAADEQWLAALSFSDHAFGLLDHVTCAKVSWFERFLWRNEQDEEAAAWRSQYPHVFQ